MCSERVTVVVMHVYLLPDTTSRAINRSTNNTTYLASGLGKKYVGLSLKLLRSRGLQRENQVTS